MGGCPVRKGGKLRESSDGASFLGTRCRHVLALAINSDWGPIGNHFM
jgi:hypothetical protein